MTTKINVAFHFDYLDQRNAMLPFMMFFTSHEADRNAVASHDTSTNANGIM